MDENEIFDAEIYTLTDDDGTESDYEMVGSVEVDGKVYYALIPYVENAEEDDAEEIEYIVLRSEKDENGEEILVSIEDDEEFDRVADIFDDEFADIDYDMPEEE